MSSPSKNTWPCVGVMRPEHTRAIVVLPEPFEPRIASTPPAGTASDTPKIARNGP